MSRLALSGTALRGLLFACLLFGFAGAAQSDETYIVEPGDHLSGIAQKVYGDSGKWPILYKANASQVYNDGNLLYVGTRLVVPGPAAGAAAAVYTPALGKLDATTGLVDIDIATGPDFTPWTDDELPNGGMVTEIVGEAFKKMGYQPAIEFINWRSGYRLTGKGKFAATFPYAPTDERKRDFLYSDSVYDTLTVVYSRRDAGFDYNELSDLRGLRACRPAGYFTDFIDDMVASGELQLEQPKTLDECYDALVKNETDLVIIAELEGNAKIKEMGIEEQVHLSEKAIRIGGLHVIFPKSIEQSEELKDKFNQTVRQMAETGELKKIVTRHLEEYYKSYGN